MSQQPRDIIGNDGKVDPNLPIPTYEDMFIHLYEPYMVNDGYKKPEEARETFVEAAEKVFGSTEQPATQVFLNYMLVSELHAFFVPEPSPQLFVQRAVARSAAEAQQAIIRQQAIDQQQAFEQQQMTIAQAAVDPMDLVYDDELMNWEKSGLALPDVCHPANIIADQPDASGEGGSQGDGCGEGDSADGGEGDDGKGDDGEDGDDGEGDDAEGRMESEMTHRVK